MKEIEDFAKIEIREEKQQEKQLKFHGSTLLKRGHTCWQFNYVTGEITKAKFETTAVDYKEATEGVILNRRKLVMKENCLYFNGLNHKSVLKQYTNLVKFHENTL